MNEKLIAKVKSYCKEIMESSRCKNLPFHNWQHTLDVVRIAKSLAEHEHLPEETTEELIIACYFHDIGNVNGAAGHEKVSCEYAQEYLTKKGYPNQRIINVIYNIKATKMPQHPETMSEKIICDADLAHLGKNNFLTKNSNLRKEWELYNDLIFTDEQWAAMNANFLKSHSFHTAYAQKHFSEQKIKNINVLEDRAFPS